MKARIPLLAAFLIVALGLAAACGGGDGAPASTADGAASSDSLGAGGAEPDFPTGEAVLIPAGYVPPEDRVDGTGAYLPANGKPTLVYVDAIW